MGAVDAVSMPQKETIGFFNEESFKADKKRIERCYADLTPQAQIEVRSGALKKVALYTLGGAAVTTATAVGIGAAIGSAFGPGGAAGGAITGLKVGIPLGLVAGCCYGLYTQKVEFLTSRRYEEWLTNIRTTDLYPIYRQTLQDDDRLEPFECLFTRELISVPMLAPDGRVYENEQITQWIHQKEEEISRAIHSGATEARVDAIRGTISLIRGQPFGVNDLKYDPTYFKRLDAVVKIKIAEMDNNKARELFTQAIAALRATAAENQKAAYYAQLGVITQHVLEHNLDPQIIKTAVKLLDQQLKADENV